MENHVVPVKVYVGICAALLFLTFTTYEVAFVNLGGRLNAVVAVAIACLKASLVVLFFMHARQSSRLVWVVIMTAIAFFVILIGLTMGDYSSRTWLTLVGS